MANLVRERMGFFFIFRLDFKNILTYNKLEIKIYFSTLILFLKPFI